jgi:adenylate kinase family enzyme
LAGLGVVCLAVLATGTIGRFALADDESDRAAREKKRAELIDKIDRRVRDISGKLSGFDSQRDYNNAEDAISYAREVADLVSELSNVKDSDSRANRIASNYPSYVGSFRDATKYLKKLKELQFAADGVADRCVHDEADLQQVIRGYGSRPDDSAEAFDKIPAMSNGFARVYVPLLDKLKDANSDFSSNASSARFDASEDNWSDGRSSYTDATARIVEYFKSRYIPIDAACKRLALGDKHPDVVTVLDDLRSYTGTTKQTVTLLKKDFNVWLADVRKLREMTAQDHEALREVMCRTGGEYEMAQKVAEVAERWSSQITNAYGTILGQSDRLAERGSSDKLKKYKGSQQVLEGIRANRATLEKLKRSDLQGSNNPKIKAKLEYGTRWHKSWQDSNCGGSNYAEFEISSSYCDNKIRPRSGCAADCVLTGSTCMIVEIKPDSGTAKAEGEIQRDMYLKGLKNWYAQNKKELFDKYPNIQKCERDGKELVIETRPEIYSFCPSSSDVKDFGENLDDISSDVSESE